MLPGSFNTCRSHPDALTSGEATGPSALRALLDALAAEHPGVQRMRCHRCGAQRALPYRRDGGSICGSCYRRTHLKVCVRCGEVGQPAFREGSGIVCTRCKSRDPARRRPCARCGTLAPVAYRVDGQPCARTAGRASSIRAPPAAGRTNAPTHSPVKDRSARAVITAAGNTSASSAGARTVQARVADRAAGTWICNRCWVPPTMTCSQCGRLRPCARGSASGRPICSTCRRASSRPRTCVHVRTHSRDSDDAAARGCLWTLLPAAAAQSGALRQLPGGPAAGRCQR